MKIMWFLMSLLPAVYLGFAVYNGDSRWWVIAGLVFGIIGTIIHLDRIMSPWRIRIMIKR